MRIPPLLPSIATVLVSLASSSFLQAVDVREPVLTFARGNEQLLVGEPFLLLIDGHRRPNQGLRHLLLSYEGGPPMKIAATDFYTPHEPVGQEPHCSQWSQWMLMGAEADKKERFLLNRAGTWSITVPEIPGQPIHVNVAGPVDKQDVDAYALWEPCTSVLAGGVANAGHLTRLKRMVDAFPTSRYAPYAAFVLARLYSAFDRGVVMDPKVVKQNLDFIVAKPKSSSMRETALKELVLCFFHTLGDPEIASRYIPVISRDYPGGRVDTELRGYRRLVEESWLPRQTDAKLEMEGLGKVPAGLRETVAAYWEALTTRDYWAACQYMHTGSFSEGEKGRLRFLEEWPSGDCFRNYLRLRWVVLDCTMLDTYTDPLTGEILRGALANITTSSESSYQHRLTRNVAEYRNPHQETLWIKTGSGWQILRTLDKSNLAAGLLCKLIEGLGGNRSGACDRPIWTGKEMTSLRALAQSSLGFGGDATILTLRGGVCWTVVDYGEKIVLNWRISVKDHRPARGFDVAAEFTLDGRRLRLSAFDPKPISLDGEVIEQPPPRSQL